MADEIKTRIPRAGKKLYSFNIPLSAEEHHRFKRFVPAMGYVSQVEFVRAAIMEKMHNDLEDLPPDARYTLEVVLEHTRRDSVL